MTQILVSLVSSYKSLELEMFITDKVLFHRILCCTLHIFTDDSVSSLKFICTKSAATKIAKFSTSLA